MELEKDLKIDIKREHKKRNCITEELKQRYYDFVQKEIPEDILALYIDAYQAEMKDKQTGKVKTITIYTVIGITLSWKKTLLGFYLEPGEKKKQGISPGICLPGGCQKL